MIGVGFLVKKWKPFILAVLFITFQKLLNRFEKSEIFRRFISLTYNRHEYRKFRKAIRNYTKTAENPQGKIPFTWKYSKTIPFFKKIWQK